MEWIIDNTVLIGKSKNYIDHAETCLFDLDGTVIKDRSGKNIKDINVDIFKFDI